ncbi:cytochrome P450 [Glonium stellatum]|uniref:Cytochrome P450 n=1 Tax=Glonium stellatum TaxID=574774 RepID=A0A8E2EWU9_9PEZI|nr:cytochrome P450 [Glonium stellatum]
MSYEYLFHGADVIDRAYIKAQGQAFEIFTPGKRQQMVTSPLHLEEINKARPEVLSLHAVAKEPKHTMKGFEWKDIRGVEGTGFVRALRTILTSYLPQLLPRLSEIMAGEVREQLLKNGHSEGCYQISIYNLAKKIVARTNCFVFFGQVLSENVEFLIAAQEFPYDTAVSAEILRLLPWPVAHFVARIYTRNYRSSRVFHDFLTREVQRRFELQERRDQKAKFGEVKPGLGRQDSAFSSYDDLTGLENDGLQWLIDTAPKKHSWSIDRLVGEIMGTWYGSVHTLTIAVTYALIDLYSRPEIIKPLRDELHDIGLDQLKGAPHELPLLDSFLKESARLSAFECTGVRRKALQPFTFSDGIHVSKDEWICVPHRSIMRDSMRFSNALQFDPFRFHKAKEMNANTRERLSQSYLTEASDTWLAWGIGRIVCPGRFYAAAILKLVLARMLVDYDCELQKMRGSRSYQWRSSLVPKRSVKLMVRNREKDS